MFCKIVLNFTYNILYQYSLCGKPIAKLYSCDRCDHSKSRRATDQGDGLYSVGHRRPDNQRSGGWLWRLQEGVAWESRRDHQ